MLDRPHRLTNGRDFARAVREGRRAGTSTMVVHLAVGTPAGWSPPGGDQRAGVLNREPRVGFVVSKAVGAAVTRNRLKRRLRHLVHRRLGELPAGAMLVVRALPPAGAADADGLSADLDRALRRVLRERERR